MIENNCECYYCNGFYLELLKILLEWDDVIDLCVS